MFLIARLARKRSNKRLCRRRRHRRRRRRRRRCQGQIPVSDLLKFYAFTYIDMIASFCVI